MIRYPSGFTVRKFSTFAAGDFLLKINAEDCAQRGPASHHARTWRYGMCGGKNLAVIVFA